MGKEQYSQMIERVSRLRQEADALYKDAEKFPALARNSARVLASIRMMEISLGVTELPPPAGVDG